MDKYNTFRQQVRREQARQAALTPTQAAAELAAECAREDKLLARAWAGVKS